MVEPDRSLGARLLDVDIVRYYGELWQYMQPSSNPLKLAFVVAFSVLIVALVAVLVIFPVIFTFGLPPEAGYGLVFQTLPALFAQLPGSSLLSTLFFSLFVLTALTSAIPLVEVVSTNLKESWGITQKQSLIYTGIAVLVLGVPSAFTHDSYLFPYWSALYGKDFLETMNGLVSIWIIPLGGLFFSLFVGWRLENDRMREAFQAHSPSPSLWRLCMVPSGTSSLLRLD